jgi:hypothetical protein
MCRIFVIFFNLLLFQGLGKTKVFIFTCILRFIRDIFSEIRRDMEKIIFL